MRAGGHQLLRGDRPLLWVGVVLRGVRCEESEGSALELERVRRDMMWFDLMPVGDLIYTVYRELCLFRFSGGVLILNLDRSVLVLSRARREAGDDERPQFGSDSISIGPSGFAR